MQKFSTLKYCSLVFCILLVFAEMTSSVPFYSDDENDVAGSNTEKDYQIRNRSIVYCEGRRNICTDFGFIFGFLETFFMNHFTNHVLITELFGEQRLDFITNKDIRDLYELLLKKKVLDDQLSQSHQISRKSNRSPSLRLRFGKKRDPYFANPPLIGHPVHMLEDVDNL